MGLYDYEGTSLDISGSPLVNVKDFGARGIGSGTDAVAIQAALDSAQTLGGVIYFPSGIYMIESPLVFYSNQTMYFEKGATLKQAASINNLMISKCADGTTEYNGTHDVIFYGGTFDGGQYTTNNTLVAIGHAKNIVFENCTFKNAYGKWHNLEINSSYNVKVINCAFEGSRKTEANGELIQIDAMHSSDGYPWSDNRGSVDGTVSKYVEISGCLFRDDTVAPAIGNHSGTVQRFIDIHDNVFDGITSTRGTIILSGTSNLHVHDNVFNGCTTGVNSSGATHFIHDNIFVSVTTAASGSSSVIHNNMINGTYTV